MKANTNLYLLAVLILCASTLSANAEIYKWKDASGKMVYSDLPAPSGQSKQIKAPVVPPETKKPANSTPSAQKTDASSAMSEVKKYNAEAAESNAASNAYNAKVKANNCKLAKEHLSNLKAGGRMFRMNHKGEREILNDQDIANEQKVAQKNVRSWCR